jgi:hypothetical protein
MKYALNLSEEGRILSATFEQYAVEGMPLVDALPEGDISDYLYHNGEYIHDPLPRQEEVEPEYTDDVLNALLGVTE